MAQHRAVKAAAQDAESVSDDVDYRKARDTVAFAAARPAALAATRALTRLLLNSRATAADIEGASQAALDAVGALWEAAAHLVRG